MVFSAVLNTDFEAYRFFDRNGKVYFKKNAPGNYEEFEVISAHFFMRTNSLKVICKNVSDRKSSVCFFITHIHHKNRQDIKAILSAFA